MIAPWKWLPARARRTLLPATLLLTAPAVQALPTDQAVVLGYLPGPQGGPSIVITVADLPGILASGELKDAWFLHDTDLIGVNFRGVTFINVHFLTSDLTGADFSDANTVDAHFDLAKLRGARFDRAKVADRKALLDAGALAETAQNWTLGEEPADLEQTQAAPDLEQTQAAPDPDPSDSPMPQAPSSLEPESPGRGAKRPAEDGFQTPAKRARTQGSQRPQTPQPEAQASAPAHQDPQTPPRGKRPMPPTLGSDGRYKLKRPFAAWVDDLKAWARNPEHLSLRPAQRTGTEQGHGLGQWVERVRRNYWNGKLTGADIQCLEGLSQEFAREGVVIPPDRDWTWGPGRSGSRASTPATKAPRGARTRQPGKGRGARRALAAELAIPPRPAALPGFTANGSSFPLPEGSSFRSVSRQALPTDDSGYAPSRGPAPEPWMVPLDSAPDPENPEASSSSSSSSSSPEYYSYSSSSSSSSSAGPTHPMLAQPLPPYQTSPWFPPLPQFPPAPQVGFMRLSAFDELGGFGKPASPPNSPTAPAPASKSPASPGNLGLPERPGPMLEVDSWFN